MCRDNSMAFVPTPCRGHGGIGGGGGVCASRPGTPRSSTQCSWTGLSLHNVGTPPFSLHPYFRSRVELDAVSDFESVRGVFETPVAGTEGKQQKAKRRRVSPAQGLDVTTENPSLHAANCTPGDLKLNKASNVKSEVGTGAQHSDSDEYTMRALSDASLFEGSMPTSQNPEGQSSSNERQQSQLHPRRRTGVREKVDVTAVVSTDVDVAVASSNISAAQPGSGRRSQSSDSSTVPRRLGNQSTLSSSNHGREEKAAMSVDVDEHVGLDSSRETQGTKREKSARRERGGGGKNTGKDQRARSRSLRGQTSGGQNGALFDGLASSTSDLERRAIQSDILYGNDAQIRSAFGQLASGNVKMSIGDFDRLLASLSRHRKLRTALGLLRIAETSPFQKCIVPYRTVKTFTIMIDVYGKARSLEMALDLFRSMRGFGHSPNVVTFNAVISSCSRNNRPELAQEIFDEMRSVGLTPDKFTYASLIDVHAKRGDVDRAFEVARMMSSSDVEKDQTIYSALMEACSRAKQLDRALLVFQDMIRQGVWPNLISFAVLLDCCANVREPYKAFQLFADMKYWELEPNVVTWTALLDACSKAGWPDRAELVLQQMRNAGIEPNEVTYGALVDAWARQGCLQRAFDVVNRMDVLDNVAPNAVLIGALIDACRKVQDGSYVAKVWALVQKHNIRPARAYYPTLVSLACLARDTDTALSVVAHCHARGMLRRVAFGRKDHVIEALAYAFVCLQRACERHEHSEKQLRRFEPLLEATALGDLSHCRQMSLEDAVSKISSKWEMGETTGDGLR